MRRRGLGPEALLVLIFAAVVAAQTEDLPVTEEEPWNIEAKTSNAVKDSAGRIFVIELTKAFDESGLLVYEPKPNASGTAIVRVKLRDNGGR